MSAVTFIHDYIQLQFDGYFINAFTPITVIDSNTITISGNDQFRNQLCSCLAKKIKKIIINDKESLIINFVDNVKIAISLKEEEYNGPEACFFHGRLII